MTPQLFLLCLGLGLVMSEMGLYYFDIDSIEKCTCQKNVNYNVENSLKVYKGDGQTRIAWNLTTPRTDGPLSVHLEMEMLRNGEFVPMYKVDMRPCTHYMMTHLMTVLGIQIDNKCKLVQGAYSMANLNPDFLGHSMTRVLQYGTLRVIWQWRVPDGCLTCSLLICSSRPRTHNSTANSTRQLAQPIKADDRPPSFVSNRPLSA